MPASIIQPANRRYYLLLTLTERLIGGGGTRTSAVCSRVVHATTSRPSACSLAGDRCKTRLKLAQIDKCDATRCRLPPPPTSHVLTDDDVGTWFRRTAWPLSFILDSGATTLSLIFWKSTDALLASVMVTLCSVSLLPFLDDTIHLQN